MPELPPELIAAILADPESDAPRLVAADWYEDAGDSDRAEFIRVQCQMATMSGLRRKPRQHAILRKRERELLTTHGEIWLQGLGLTQNLRDWERFFQRGFVYFINAILPPTFAEAQSLIHAFPCVEFCNMRLSGPVPSDWLRDFARLQNLRMLHLMVERADLTWETLEPLTTLPRLNSISLVQTDPLMELLSDELRQQFQLAQAQHREQSHEGSPSRLANLRKQIGAAIESTTSGLDQYKPLYLSDGALELARSLTTLRRIEVLHFDEVDLAAIAAMPMIRSLTLHRTLPDTPQILAPMTCLREVILLSHSRAMVPTLGDWLTTQSHLETLSLPATSPDGIAELFARIHRCPSLKVLHLPTINLDVDLLNQFRFPELIELDATLRIKDSLDWLRNFPKLRVLYNRNLFSLHPTDQQSVQAIKAYRRHGVNVIPLPPRWELEPLPVVNAEALELAHGIHLRVPSGLQRIEPAQSPHATADIEALAAWQEFGPGDEWPDLRTLAPTRIWLERIEAPAGTQTAREWLQGPLTPFRDVNWSGFVSIPVTGTLKPRVLTWSHEHFRGLRAVWIGKQSIIRMIGEFSSKRATPWHKILPAMIASVRVPAGF